MPLYTKSPNQAMAFWHAQTTLTFHEAQLATTRRRVIHHRQHPRLEGAYAHLPFSVFSASAISRKIARNQRPKLRSLPESRIPTPPPSMKLKSQQPQCQHKARASHRAEDGGEVRGWGSQLRGCGDETRIWFDLASIKPNLAPIRPATGIVPPLLLHSKSRRAFPDCRCLVLAVDRRLPRPPHRCSPAPIWSKTTPFRPSSPLF